MTKDARAAIAALLFFAAWTWVTWLLEGRIDTLLRPEAVGARIAYAFIANLMLGVCGGILFVWYWRKRGVLSSLNAGLLPSARTAPAIAAGLGLGLAAYFLQGAPSTSPIVIVNAFAQVFVVSAAEVLVCWSVVGASVRAALRPRGRRLSLVIGWFSAAFLFGVYHFAHSAPFNTWPMVALLGAVGLVTGVFFFATRDAVATVVFHNFLGTFGVVQALAKAQALDSLHQLQPSLLFTAALTAVALVGGALIHVRARTAASA